MAPVRMLLSVSLLTDPVRVSIGSSTHWAIRVATRAAVADAASAPAAMSDQRIATSLRTASVDTINTTAPLTCSSHPTGSASTLVCGPQGLIVGRRSVERPVRA